MITLGTYKGKSVGVFGLGKAGQAAVHSLLASGAEVYAWDDKGADSLSANDQRLTTKNFTDWPWQSLSALILSPGVPLTHPVPHPVVVLAKEAGIPVIGEVELLSQACPEAKIIGITGTNGKSTTTALTAHILKECGYKVEVGGNLGTPALALAPLGADGVYVIEMSSYQLDLINKARFHVAVLLNITPDHLDRHGDMKGYIRAKKRIFLNQQKADTAIIAMDDNYTNSIGHELKSAKKQKLDWVSSTRAMPQDYFVQDGKLVDEASSAASPYVFDISHIPTLQGRHNWQNAACAYAAARAVGAEPKAIYAAMQSFPGLAHRMEVIATIDNVKFINDSKATNADATANALAAYDSIHWILGGKAKAGGIESLSEFFPKIRHAWLIGEAQDAFADTLQGKVAYTKCGTLEKAVKLASDYAFSHAQDASVVLLSPACASFDQFKSFEHRGDVFRELVKGLGNGTRPHK